MPDSDLFTGAEFGKKSGQLVKTSVTGFKFFSRSHDAVIRVYDAGGSVIETHEQERR
jgi:hypothetical protein